MTFLQLTNSLSDLGISKRGSEREKPSDQQHLIDWFIDAMPADLQFERTQALELTHMVLFLKRATWKMIYYYY